MTTVLFIRTHSSQLPVYQERLTGVCNYARGVDWHVQTIDRPTAAQVRKLLSFWKPVGCIIESGSGKNLYPESLFKGLPVIYLDRDPQTLPRKAFCVACDSVPIAQLAAKELLSLGLPHYAFVGNFTRISWSEVRRDAFVDALALNGRPCAVFAPTKASGDSVVFRRQLGEWLKGLPKPCGVFAANDPVGGAVLSACQEAGIDVPSEVAVLGVDNLEILCENTHPSLSSIMIDYEHAGRLAAELLARRLQKPSLKPKVLTFGACGVIRRLSTRELRRHNPAVVAAVERIRREACSGLKARDVIADMGCSRRLAEMRFREVLDHSILEEIQEARFSRATTLLLNPSLSVEEVAARCGYRSVAFLQKLFHRRTGRSMRAWREETLRSARA